MTASDEKWRPFNCFFFQSGRGKDLSAPLYIHDISLQIRNAQTGSGDHPPSSSMSTGNSFLEGHSSRCVKLTAHLHLVPSLNYVDLYLHSLHYPFHGVYWDNFTCHRLWDRNSSVSLWRTPRAANMSALNTHTHTHALSLSFSLSLSLSLYKRVLIISPKPIYRTVLQTQGHLHLRSTQVYKPTLYTHICSHS